MENFNKKNIKIFLSKKIDLYRQMLSIPDNCGVTFPKELSYFFLIKRNFFNKTRSRLKTEFLFKKQKKLFA